MASSGGALACHGNLIALKFGIRGRDRGTRTADQRAQRAVVGKVVLFHARCVVSITAPRRPSLTV
eukprot:6791239-Prymnesium_polylepis.1